MEKRRRKSAQRQAEVRGHVAHKVLVLGNRGGEDIGWALAGGQLVGVLEGAEDGADGELGVALRGATTSLAGCAQGERLNAHPVAHAAAAQLWVELHHFA